MPNASYTNRYRQAKRTKPQTKNKMMKERNINFSKKENK